MANAATKTGLIAFFDVLGYRNLIRNNDVNHCALIIQNRLLRLPDEVHERMQGRAAQYNRDWAQKTATCLGKPIIFSDSIVWDFALNAETEADPRPWLYFILTCCLLQRAMFDLGLPVRGAISFGEYFIAENCFAGRPIVDAHELCEQLGLVGCAMTSQAENARPKGQVGGIDAFAAVLVEYPTPLKGAERSQAHWLLNWAFPGGTFLEPFGDDIRFRILQAFTSHRKPIGRNVQAKVTNTEAFLHYCKAACEKWNRENPKSL